MLAAMVATSLAFYAVAASHRDAEVERVEVRAAAASVPAVAAGAAGEQVVP